MAKLPKKLVYSEEKKLFPEILPSLNLNFLDN